jgi:acetyltransferase-like isoleucine patch superfamily enzyme
MNGNLLEHDWFPRPLPGNVEIGPNSWLYSSFAFLHFQSRLAKAVVIGDHSGIYNGTFFDLGPQGNIEIGDYCTIVGAIFSSNARIRIGDYVFIAHEVTIADFAFATPEHQASSTSANVHIGHNVWIGARSIILGGTRIGEGAVVGAASLVDFDVPPQTVVAGNPARIVKALTTKR